MPDAPHTTRRSRGPAAGRLWSGQAGPESPAPPPPAAETPHESTVFRADTPTETPTAVVDGPPARNPRVWPRAIVGGAVSGLAVALAAVAVIGPLTDDDAATPAASNQPPAVVSSGGAKNSSSVGQIYAAASPAVASIQTGGGSGTGFLVGAGGTVISNAHVVGESSTVRVKFGDDGRTITGRVTGKDTSTDLAVIRVDRGDIDGIRPLQWGNSDDVKVGDLAVAIGNPLGLPQTATAGIVSGLQREIQAPNGFQIDEVIQTDAPINPGNSGGPLLDQNARVVGVNSQIATSGAGSGNIGIGFAVPANTAKDVVPQLESGQAIARPWIGVSTGPASGGGAEVGEVTPGGPASKAGLRPGDVITSVDGKRITEPDDVAGAISSKKPGDKVEIEVRRSGEGSDTISVDLGNRPR